MTTGNPRDIDLYIRRLQRAESVIPSVLDHLNEQAAVVTTLRAARYDDARSGSTVPDPTSDTAGEYERLRLAETDVLRAIFTVGLAINSLDEACRYALRARATVERAGDGPVGPEFGHCIGSDARPECEQIPASRRNRHTGEGVDDGRCIDCGPAHDEAQHQREVERAAEANARRARRYAQRSEVA